MFRYILPIILIAISVTGFFIVTDPLYNKISLAKDQIASFNEALDNSKALEAERDKLTQKYNSFDPGNITKLQKLLPDNVDNIRLILEIENIASPYGMVLKDVKYDATDNNAPAASQTIGNVKAKNSLSNKNYGIWDLEFSTQGTYSNLVSFIKDLENNLRIVDVSSIDFSSGANPNIGLNPSLPEAYKYNFRIRTYWLKN